MSLPRALLATTPCAKVLRVGNSCATFLGGLAHRQRAHVSATFHFLLLFFSQSPKVAQFLRNLSKNLHFMRESETQFWLDRWLTKS